jgi:putative molybdopterin biosynthesis protein
MKRYLQTITREEAVKRILVDVRPIDEEEFLPVYLSAGRITSRAVVARLSNPPFVCSAMDGYAVAFEKTMEADLTNPVSLHKGSDAVPVNTGDPLPNGTNAVIMIEEVEEREAEIVIRKPAYLWQNVRMVGEDIIERDMMLPTNHVLTVLDAGMLISAGLPHIYVRRRPRILVVPTGKELVDIFTGTLHEEEHRGLIDFNSYILWKMAEDMGFDAVRHEIVCDRETLRTILEASSGSYDVIVINAGSSAGSEDFTEELLKESGQLIFHGVSMMPGKPTMFARVKGKPVFGIPGYPVSAVISFDAFVLPLFERLTGIKRPKRYATCVAPYKIPSRIGVEEILRVTLAEKGGIYYGFPLPRGASLFSSMANADALVSIPEETEGYDEGVEMPCLLLKDEEAVRRRIHIIGSHDLSLDVLRDMLKGRWPDRDLVSTHVGSLSGILAFRNGLTDLCTTHIIDEATGTYNVPIIEKYLPDRSWALVHIARRLQGLFVQQGNPRNIRDVTDIAREGIKFVNRQYGSGTRILLDRLLKERGIEKEAICGYDREESSHTSAGILVKESVADVAPGIYGVAKAFSLGFIPLAEEDYDLLVAKEFMSDARFGLLLELICSEEFRKTLQELGGYNTKDTGRITHVNG